MYDLLITGGTLVTPGFVVAGNCGVGLDWNWRSFPEYMDRLGERALNHEPR
jgi:hypothetical protein